jgi:26S proteasome regulatory subunit N9
MAAASGAASKPLEFLEQLQAEHPGAQADIAELASLYQRKLWHQLTVKIDALIKSDGPLNSGDVPLRLFERFVLDFASRINLLKLAQFAVHATKALTTPAPMVAFLEGVLAKLEELKLGHKADEPALFLRMHIAQHQVEQVGDSVFMPPCGCAGG